MARKGKPKRIGHVVGTERVNGVPTAGVPIVGRPHLIEAKDPLGEAIRAQEQKDAREAHVAEWSKAFEAAAEQGAPHLLAFLMSGLMYTPDTVFDRAVEVLAAMTAGGYLVIRQDQLAALIESAVQQTREGNNPFDPTTSEGKPADA
jgi:hypothetical protein